MKSYGAMTVIKAGSYSYEPEPPTTPPEDKYDTAGCGHEIYDGETVVTWNGKEVCQDCFADEVMRFLASENPAKIAELAEMLRCEHRTVSIGGAYEHI